MTLQEKLLKKAKKMRVQKLSNKTGLARTHLYRIFSKKGNPRLRTIERICKSLHVELTITDR